MSFWAAILGIVAITLTFDYLKTVAKAKQGVSGLNEKLAAEAEKLTKLETEMSGLQAENARLREALEEQKILADEAVSTYGSRMDRLRRERQAGHGGTETVAEDD